MKVVPCFLLRILPGLCLVLLSACTILEDSESNWDESNDAFYRWFIAYAVSQPAEPYVRFQNNAGTAEKYIVFGNSSCSGSPLVVFASINQGEYTDYFRRQSFYLNIDGSNCISTAFDLGRYGNAISFTNLTCIVGSTSIQCDDSNTTTVTR